MYFKLEELTKLGVMTEEEARLIEVDMMTQPEPEAFAAHGYPETCIVEAVGSAYGMKAVDLSSFRLTAELINAVPRRKALAYRTVPYEIGADRFVFATASWWDVIGIGEQLRHLVDGDIELCLAKQSDIDGILNNYHVAFAEGLEMNPSKAELAARLQRLEACVAPERSDIAAMCYSIGAPGRFDYVCPDCQERTVYASGNEGDRESSYSVLSIPACRRLVGSLAALNPKLDESDFCRACGKEAGRPSLRLELDLAGDECVIDDVTLNDLKLMEEFVTGNAEHSESFGTHRPLRDYSKRIAELLGLAQS